MSQTIAQSSFGKGELSPYLKGRVDTQHYYASAESLQNMLIRPYGDPVRRAGTKYVATIDDPENDKRLIEFVFSTDVSYIIEVGAGYFKFYKDNELITVDMTTATTWTTATEYAIGDFVKVEGVLGEPTIRYYFCKQAHTSDAYLTDGIYSTWVDPTNYVVDDYVTQFGQTYKCITDHNSGFLPEVNEPALGNGWWLFWKLANDDGMWTHYRNANTIPDTTTDWPLRISHPYGEGQLWDVDYAQKDDVIKLTAGNRDIGELRRYSDTQWAYVQGVISGPPWAELNSDADHTMDKEGGLTPGGVTGFMKSSKPYFTSAHVGRYMRIGAISTALDSTGEQAYVQIMSIDSDIQAQVQEVVAGEGSGIKTTRWSLNAFYHPSNFPAHVTYHESRLVLGNTTLNPQKEWFSKSFVYNEFNTGDVAEFGFDLTLNTAQANKLQWISSGQNLSSGTFGGEFISTSPVNGSLSGLTKNARPQSSWGSVFVRPKKVGNRLYFVQRGSRKLRELFYVDAVDNYEAQDMTKYADHITLSGIVDMDYQRNIDSLLWCVLDNGEMAVFARDPEDDVQAWTPWVTDGDVKSIRFTPNPDGLSDRGTMIVERVINGQTVKYIESFDNHVIEDDTDQSDLYYVDCGVEYNDKSSETDTDFTGLDHLEAEVVSIFTDGVYRGTGTVSSGEVTNTYGPWLKAAVGLPYTSTVKTNPLASLAAKDSGKGKGKIRRIDNISLDVYKTLGIEYSSDGVSWFPVELPEIEDEDVFFTGTIPNLTFEGILDYTGSLYLRQTKPYPFNLLGIYAQVLFTGEK